MSLPSLQRAQHSSSFLASKATAVPCRAMWRRPLLRHSLSLTPTAAARRRSRTQRGTPLPTARGVEQPAPHSPLSSPLPRGRSSPHRTAPHGTTAATPRRRPALHRPPGAARPRRSPSAAPSRAGPVRAPPIAPPRAPSAPFPHTQRPLVDGGRARKKFPSSSEEGAGEKGQG